MICRKRTVLNTKRLTQHGPIEFQLFSFVIWRCPVVGECLNDWIAPTTIMACLSAVSLRLSSSTTTFIIFCYHQQYEALLYECFQVQETISRPKTWACANKFDLDTHNKHHWSHSYSWNDCERTTYPRRQCECLASPIASLCIDLLLLSRPLIISDSLPRFPLWRSVIFDL